MATEGRRFTLLPAPEVRCYHQERGSWVPADMKTASRRAHLRVFRSVPLLLWLATANGLWAQAGAPPAQGELFKGAVIPRVSCAAQSSETYALYLPSYFTVEKNWPVILALDPAARGAVPVELLKGAAEKYGYIVAGSNNSRNGPFPPQYDSAVAMAKDVSTRFPVDLRRVYFAGFSGGARSAVYVALLCKGCAAGVILHGAGFPIDRPPSSEVSFSVFSAIGLLDFNYFEVVPLQVQFEKLGITHRLRRFEGSHQWAPPEVWMEAVEWLELTAMKQNRRPHDDTFIRNQLAVRLDRASALAAADDFYAAWQEYRDIASDFDGLIDTSASRQKSEQLAGDRRVRDGQRDEQREFSEELRVLDEFNRAFDQLMAEPAQRSTAKSAVETQIALIKRRRESEKKGWRNRVAERAFSQVTARLFEAGDGKLREKDFAFAITLFELLSASAPDNPGPFYQLARAYARAGKKKETIRAVEQAVRRGFNRPDLLQQEEFSSLRGEIEFEKLLDAVARKAQ